MSNIHERMGNTMKSLIDEELSKFQGTWMQVRCEADGVLNPPDEFGPQPLTTFSGNT